MKRADVSVIIPEFNTQDLVGDAIHSVCAQSVAVREIIVVDDASTDASIEVIEGLKISGLRLIRHAVNAGPSAARNTGIREATGEYIAFIDADDLWLECKLKRQIQLMNDNPDTDIVWGHTTGDEIENIQQARGALQSVFSNRFFLQVGAMLFRARVFDRVGVFDETMRTGEDMDWCLRAQEANVSIVEHDDNVLCYRRHRNNITNDLNALRRGAMLAFKKSAERKRQQRS